MFHFGVTEIVWYCVGYYLPFAFFTFVQFVTDRSAYDDRLKADRLVCIGYVAVNTAVYAVSYLVGRAYFSRYIDRRDDLLGENEPIQNIVREQPEPITYAKLLETLKVIVLPWSLTFLNFAINSTATRFFMQALDFVSKEQSQPFIMFVMNTAAVAGCLIALLLQPDIYATLASTMVRVSLLVLLAFDNYNRNDLMRYPLVWLVVLAVFSILQGLNLCSLFVNSSVRVQEKGKKNVGYLMAYAVILGSSYGDFSSLLIFT